MRTKEDRRTAGRVHGAVRGVSKRACFVFRCMFSRRGGVLSKECFEFIAFVQSSNCIVFR